MNGVSVFATFEKSYFQFILGLVSFPISFLQFLNFSMIQACARARVFFLFCFYLTMISTCASILNYSIMPPS